MKKFFLILGLLLVLCTNSWADICYKVNDKVATNAVAIIQTQKEIYQYCSICPDAVSEIITVKNIQKSNTVYVDGIALDLAHTYYKKDNKFINLGVTSGCIKAGDYDIPAELDNVPNIHHTQKSNRKQAKKQSQEIYEKCVDKAQIKENTTTSDMIKQNIKINDCLVSAIKSEIENGFNPEKQKEMIETFNQIRKSVWKFYYDIYAENKYCYGTCGTIANVLPYADEGKILMEMLEKSIYLNLSKNGY